MVSETQRRRVCGYLEEGQREGVRALVGGKAGREMGEAVLENYLHVKAVMLAL